MRRTLTIIFISLGLIFLGTWFYYSAVLNKKISWQKAHQFILNHCKKVPYGNASSQIYLAKLLPLDYNYSFSSKYPFISKGAKAFVSLDPIDQNGLYQFETNNFDPYAVPDLCWVVWTGNKSGGQGSIGYEDLTGNRATLRVKSYPVTDDASNF